MLDEGGGVRNMLDEGGGAYEGGGVRTPNHLKTSITRGVLVLYVGW